MSDIHNIYCWRVPALSPRASLQRLCSLLNAPQAEYEPAIPVYLAQNRARVRPHDVRDWYPTVSLKQIQTLKPVLLNTCLYISVARFWIPDELRGATDYKNCSRLLCATRRTYLSAVHECSAVCILVCISRSHASWYEYSFV